MAELTIDRTYGQALYQAAKDLDKVDVIGEEIADIVKIMEDNPKFPALLNDPVIAAKEKKEVLKTVFEGRVEPAMLNFFYVLVDKGRTRHFQQIAKEYLELLHEEEGVILGTVFSAAPLTETQLAKVQTETAKLLGGNVKLENKIDKSLIGGLKILADGKIIDASLKKRLDELSATMQLS